MSEYLNLTGIISLKELTNALQNGKLSEMVHFFRVKFNVDGLIFFCNFCCKNEDNHKKTQLKKIQREYFPDRAFRRIIVESVKVDIDSNGLRITPSLVQDRIKMFFTMTTIIIIDFLTAPPLIYSPSKFGKQILTLRVGNSNLEYWTTFSKEVQKAKA